MKSRATLYSGEAVRINGFNNNNCGFSSLAHQGRRLFTEITSEQINQDATTASYIGVCQVFSDHLRVGKIQFAMYGRASIG
jgi:hypothetical protein